MAQVHRCVSPFHISVSCPKIIKPSLLRYKDKVTDHNFGSLIRMNADEEYSESNTIFGALCTPSLGPVTDSVGSDASAIPGFRGKRHVMSEIVLDR